MSGGGARHDVPADARGGGVARARDGVTAAAGSPGPGDGLQCPWCGAADVERIGAFGAQLMSEQYLCRVCRSPFERVRK